MWTDLRERFGQGDAYRVSDLYEEIYTLKQGMESVIDFHMRLKTLWDELAVLRPIPYCNCDPKCACARKFAEIRTYFENDFVARFLKGLNEEYGNIRSQIMSLDPIPSMNITFGKVARYERQNAGVLETHSSIDSSQEGYVSAINAGKRNFSEKPSKCTFCGKLYHTEAKCYKKHGFPPNFKTKGKEHFQMANQVQSEETTKGLTHGLSAEQFQQLLQFVKKDLQDASANKHGRVAAITSQTLSANFQEHEQTANDELTGDAWVEDDWFG
ncbi:unnamed protein product [Cuscuta epithymum]|uniref:Retrotransposon gag domain-containing protein n=1 Tax=Cuscuta epithymum TaxID=186058 RepID=A0AAV0FJA3_9ASTE|nr:unnamed protein product [Cuscuta epithymum]